VAKKSFDDLTAHISGSSCYENHGDSSSQKEIPKAYSTILCNNQIASD